MAFWNDVLFYNGDKVNISGNAVHHQQRKINKTSKCRMVDYIRFLFIFMRNLTIRTKKCDLSSIFLQASSNQLKSKQLKHEEDDEATERSQKLWFPDGNG